MSWPVTPRTGAAQLARLGAPVRQDGARRTLREWARFPELTEVLLREVPALAEAEGSLREEILEDARYAPYLERQQAEIDDLRRQEAVTIPAGFDYVGVGGLSTKCGNGWRPRVLRRSPPPVGCAASRRRRSPRFWFTSVGNRKRHDRRRGQSMAPDEFRCFT